MIRNRLIFLWPAAVLLVFLVMAGFALNSKINGTSSSSQAPTSVLINRPAPDLPEQALSTDLATNLQDLKGQPVLVNFMASWCIPCRAEIPALDVLKDDLKIIAVAYKDKDQDTLEFLKEYGNPYDGVWMDKDGRTGVRWGIYGVPETFLIDAKGRVVLRHAGPIYKSVIDDVIKPALDRLTLDKSS